MSTIDHERLFVTYKLEDGEVDLDGFRRYRPGDTIKGVVQVEAREDVRCRGVEVQWEWHTEGKGTRDGIVIARKVLASDSLRARQQVGDQFVFTLPPQPWSYAGHFITIVWSLTVAVDIPMGRDIKVEQPIIVDPGE